MLIKATPLVSFDGTERVNAKLVRPERYSDLFAGLSASDAFIARGAGLSYAAASMGGDALSIDMKRFNRILAFDPDTGDVAVEPGISVGALIEFLGARGFCLPVVPGYPDITVGGCVALDVHGKSQFHSGNFGDWVTSIELFHPAHGALLCSPRAHSDVLELTIGGFGLTGVITRVELRTTRLPGPALELETAPVSNLRAAVELMEERAAHVAALYSWHNLTQRGARFGSGVVFMERFVGGPSPRPAGRRWLPLERRSPLGLWTRATTPIVMGCYERLQQKRKPRVLGLRAGFFPIAGLESYYAAFGARGLREYQLIVPRERWSDFVAALEPVLSQSRAAITLASLKLFKGAGKFLRFRGAGVCLALDVPANARALHLFTELDRMALEYGACVNIGKDSRIEASACRALFPEYETYKEQLQAFDPARRCRSRLRERIDV